VGRPFWLPYNEKRTKRRATEKTWRQRRSLDPDLGPVSTYITTDETANQLQENRKSSGERKGRGGNKRKEREKGKGKNK
jgi:hypothetical protein